MAYSVLMTTLKYLDLFDDIPYKYVKNIIDDDYEDFDVDIEHLECDQIAWCETKFTFKLSVDVSGGSMPLMVEKTFEKVLHYNCSSGFALTIMEIQNENEYEDDDDNEEDNDNEEPSEESSEEPSEDNDNILTREQ